MNKLIKIAMFILIVLRVTLSVCMGVWFPAGQLWDDNLMMRFAGLSAHFLSPEYFALVKDMSFPLFVRAFSVTKIPYSALLGLLWSAAALVSYFTFKKILSGKRHIPFLIFVYVLFMPQAFDMWSGTRLYRNGIIAPFTIMTLMILISFMESCAKGERFMGLKGILLGILFSFTYYIKEDGLWLMCTLLFGGFLTLIYIIFAPDFSLLARRIGCLLLPFIVFFAVTGGYKAVNHRFFGVYEINTRTDGELGEFLEKIYSIDSDHRTYVCWTPYDAIEKAFEASETLGSYPELLESIKATDWRDGDIIANPIPGDHLGWILRDCLADTGIWENEKQVSDLFSKINDELDEAFSSGKLSKQKGVVRIVSSAGGYTLEETAGLFREFYEGLLGAVLLKGYESGLGGVERDEIEENIILINAANEYTNLDYLGDYSKISGLSKKTESIADVIFVIYRAVNGLLFCVTVIVSVVGTVFFFISLIKREKSKKKNQAFLYLLGSVSFLGISAVYDFAIGWFSAFLFEDGISNLTLNFYNIALPGLLMFAYAFAVTFLYQMIASMDSSQRSLKSTG
ncbi:MAG: hypothetical protein K6D96_09845 [Acetatifactor sp.]|nr:hypothetical protein [Acetatifactor sp.]